MSNKYQLPTNITLKEIDGQTVLFSKKTGDFYGLNDTATYLLKELVESDFDATLTKAASIYKVSPEELRTDLLEIVADLEGKKLLTKISA